MKFFLLILILMVSTASFSQELTDRQKRRLKKLEIEFLNYQDPEQISLMQQIHDQEGRRIKNKICGYSLGTFSAYSFTLGTILISQPVEEGDWGLSKAFGSFFMIYGVSFGTGSFFTFRTAKRRAADRDVMIEEFHSFSE